MEGNFYDNDWYHQNTDYSGASWYKVQVRNPNNVDPVTICKRIHAYLGQPVNFCSWKQRRDHDYEFYVQDETLAWSMTQSVKNRCGKGVTFVSSLKPNNPPAAQVTSELRAKLSGELTSRFNQSTGHLNLSNFADTNGLISEYYLPLCKPTICAVVNEIIKGNKMISSQVTSVDLSHNKLYNFEHLDFLTDNNNIRTLRVNDNRINYISTLISIQSMQLTALVVKNNPLWSCSKVNYSRGGQRTGYNNNYKDEIRKIFPSLVTLDNVTIFPLPTVTTTKRNLPSVGDDSGPPTKVPRSDPESSSSSSSNHVIKVNAKENEENQEELLMCDSNNSEMNNNCNKEKRAIAEQQQQQQQQSKADDCQQHNHDHDKCNNRIENLQNQLDKSMNKIEDLSKLIVDLTAFQQKSENDFLLYRQKVEEDFSTYQQTIDNKLKQVQEDNLWFNLEIERLKSSFEEQNHHRQNNNINDQPTTIFIEPPNPPNNDDGTQGSSIVQSLADISHLFDRPQRPH